MSDDSMKRRVIYRRILVLILLFAQTTVYGCGTKSESVEKEKPEKPALAIEFETSSEIVVTPEPEKNSDPEMTQKQDEQNGRQDGERFEETIILEGMEETVKYEHVRNDVLGFEMDYDYESFQRQKEQDCEKFVSIYDDPKDPWNYLEVTYVPMSADSVEETISGELSETYEIIRDTRTLDNAGDCIVIDASADKGGKTMPDLLQVVYIIPAGSGSIVARAHYAAEAAEGFGRRFSYMMNTLSVKNDRIK